MISEGQVVSIQYTLKTDDGATVDSNVGREPLTYKHGSQQILPALEQALEGLKVDDTMKITLPPEKAYGDVDPKAFQKVAVDQLPENAREAGAQLMAQDNSGNKRPLRVKEIQGSEAVLDFNHPLAGHTLSFEIRIVGIEQGQ